RDRIAVLAGLNLAFELEQAQAAPQAAPDAAADTLPDGDVARLRELVAKLDHALGDDGQLL
ncbi:MAG: cell division protein ZapA, partial [Burkholderiaceae bacterium]